jgi:hypothetical protein
MESIRIFDEAGNTEQVLSYEATSPRAAIAIARQSWNHHEGVDVDFDSPDVVYLDPDWLYGGDESEEEQEAACAWLVERCRQEWPGCPPEIMAEHLQSLDTTANNYQRVNHARAAWFQQAFDNLNLAGM